MQITHIGHLLHLHGFKAGILVLLACFLAQPTAEAQKRGPYNFDSFAKKPYYFGITLGYNSSRYRLVQSDAFIQNDSIYGIESARGPGFNLGIVSNFKIGRYMDLRMLPTLSFADKALQYQQVNNDFVEKRIESVFLELPVHLRYKSAVYNDVRVFVVGGFKYSYDLASNSRTRQADDLITVSPHDFSVEYGVGIQMFFPYFIFSPEIKISQGLGNVLVPNDDLLYSNTLEKILSRTFTISLHFEG